MKQVSLPIAFLLSNVLLAAPTVAQIVPDATLPVNSIAAPNGKSWTIEGGTTAGSNLFHSFDRFDVPTNAEAFFNNASTIDNIITRITGGQLSNIDGLLRANGTANLFLLNPTGIIFGPNAQLSIGGSFFGSTADSIVFADGSQFSATEPETLPLLSINVPIGLQFGSNPGRIVDRSQAASLIELPTLNTPIPISQAVGLEVPPGQTLALVGGDILLEGGNLTALQGEIQLGSVASPGFVSFRPTATGITLGYDDIDRFGTIDLSDTSIVNVSGLGGGAIRVKGGNVTVREGSSLIAATLGTLDGRGIDIEADRFQLQRGLISTSTFDSGAGGTLNLRASEEAELVGSGFETLQLTLFLGAISGTLKISDAREGLLTGTGGVGNAGDLTIDTSRLVLREGALISTTTGGAGSGGNAFVSVSDSVEITGSIFLTGTLQGTSGSAGNLTLETQRITLQDGGLLQAFTFGSGRGGDISIDAAESVELLRTPPGAFVPTGIFANSIFGTGAGGNIEVNTQNMVMLGGAQVGNQTGALLGTGLIPLGGPGGNIVLNVSDSLEMVGISPDGRFGSGPGTTSFSGFAAGDTTIVARNLTIRDGASIEVSTLSAGKGGDVDITVSESLELSGTGIANRQGVAVVFPSTLSSSSGRVDFPTLVATGAAGALRIRAGEAIVRDGAAIEANSQGSGDAGTLELVADSLRLENGGTVSTSTASGAGGNVALTVRDLQLRGGSRISTDAGNTDGGNIAIDADTVVALENSDITANAQQGFGGGVSITTRGIFGTQFRSNLTPESDITATSALGPQFNGVVEIQNPDTDTSSGLVELTQNPIDSTDRIVRGCAAGRGNTFTITGRGGLSDDPTAPLRDTTSWSDTRDWRQIGEQVATVDLPRLPLTDDSRLVEATAWVRHADGTVELVAQVPGSPWQSRLQCQ
ncbi:MAG: S-layer family protein [Geitlerinemataceae cyanobacterium]